MMIMMIIMIGGAPRLSTATSGATTWSTFNSTRTRQGVLCIMCNLLMRNYSIVIFYLGVKAIKASAFMKCIEHLFSAFHLSDSQMLHTELSFL